MDKKGFEDLRRGYEVAKKLERNIDNTRQIVDGIRRRQAKGTSDYEVSFRRKADGYNSSIYVTIPEHVVAAMVPGLKIALDNMREEFKAL